MKGELGFASRAMSGSLLLTVYHPGCASRASELLSVRYVITYQDVYAASHCELHTGCVPTCQPHHCMRQTVTLTEMAAFSAANRDAAGKPRCFNFWRRAPAVTPSVVLLTRERRIELCAIALRVSTLRSTRATSWQALVRFTREESSPSDPVRHRDVQAAPKMCRQSIPPCRMCMPHLSTCELHTEVG